MKTLFLSALLVLISVVQLSAVPSRMVYYRGTIGTYEIELNLVFDTDDSSLGGNYRYLNKNAWLDLKGAVDKELNFTLNEFPHQENDVSTESSGILKGSIRKDGSVDGFWSDLHQIKTFPMNLKPAYGTGAAFQFGHSEASVKAGENGASATIDYLNVQGIDPSIAHQIDTFIFNRLFYGDMFNDVLGNPHIPSFGEYDSIASRYVGTNYNNDWNSEWIAGCDVVWNGSGILCLDNYNWEYSGGAHGNGYSEYNCFDLRTGKLLTADDIFLKGYNEPLRQKAIEHLDSDDLFMEKSALQLNGNFFITPEGICYFYNSYEIACYMCGTPSAFIPWSEVNKWIDPNGPMAWVKK